MAYNKRGSGVPAPFHWLVEEHDQQRSDSSLQAGEAESVLAARFTQTPSFGKKRNLSMGYKFNQKTGYWEAYFGKRHPITREPISLRRRRLKSKTEAKRVERELIAELELALHEKVVPKWTPLVEEYRKVSLEKGMTGKTVENYYLCLKAHTFEAWSNRTVDAITTEDIRTLIKARVGDKAPSHQKNMLKFIRGVFIYAVEIGVIDRNPTPDMKFRVGDKIKRVLTEPQAETLLNKAKEYNWEWYPHVAMAIYTGMRNGELYALTWDKVNLDERTILIDSSWNSKDGFKSTKSGDDRVAEIAPPLLPILRELRMKSADSCFVLPRLSRWDIGCQAEALRMFLIGLGLPVVRFHDLRATWCTLMLAKGVEPAKVMIMGGWKDLKTMMVYMRKAGINIRGITDVLMIHNPSRESAMVLEFGSRSDE
jgi:integrase